LTLTLTPALTLTLTRYNTFEQLCINFTNERLQSHFTDALIKRQQEDYKREGVTCAHINFPDNELQIQLIDGNKGSVS
jgi:myosin heavy subunit